MRDVRLTTLPGNALVGAPCKFVGGLNPDALLGAALCNKWTKGLHTVHPVRIQETFILE